MKLNLANVTKRLKRSGVIITVALASMLLQTQCFVQRPAMTTGVVDRVALMGTLVSFQQPTGINVPAGIARSHYKNMSVEINQLMASYADTLHKAVAANLSTQLGCEVVYGTELQSLPQFADLRESYERADALMSVDEHFPQVYISSGDFNFIVTESNGGDATGLNGMKTLKPDEVKQTVMSLCSELNIKYLAYAHFRLSGYKMDLVTPNTAILWYGVNLYNHEGELIASGVAMKEGRIREGQPEVFQSLLDQYLLISETVQLKTAK
ncbi:MAG TPA: hypothetical protein PLV06_14715 [Bacteroidales bacterium]|nr:hypothetical protein [Bacteroidales bacterium]HPJ60877.1 hypothetical protein [Bacteroidales bacterium]HPR13637.1 hypothetical protein [Bacteroidales bacterium]